MSPDNLLHLPFASHFGQHAFKGNEGVVFSCLQRKQFARQVCYEGVAVCDALQVFLGYFL